MHQVNYPCLELYRVVVSLMILQIKELVFRDTQLTGVITRV
jgi:hypothetical protein